MSFNSPRDVHLAIRTLQDAGFTVMWEAPGPGGKQLHRFTAVREGDKWTAEGADAFDAVVDVMQQVGLAYPD